MTLIKSFDGVEYQGVFRASSNPLEVNKNIKRNIIDNFSIFIVGTTGSGKSTFINRICQEMFYKDSVVIHLTEKDTKPFANAFSIFPIQAEWHLNKLKQIEGEPAKIPVKLYHPFTFSLKKGKKYPKELNFFTFDIRKLTENALCSIMSDENPDKESITSLRTAQRKLKPSDNIYDFLDIVQGIMQREDLVKTKYDPSKFIQETSSVGDKKTIDNIESSFGLFKHHFFLDNANNPHNLDIEKLINDSKHIHLLSTHLIYDRRVKLFAILNLLEMITEAIEQEKNRKRIVLVFEEVLDLFSIGEQASYEKLLVSMILKTLSKIRTDACVLMSSQLYSKTKTFKGLCSEFYLMKCSIEDRRRFSKDYGVPSDDMDTINELDKGEYIDFNLMLKQTQARKSVVIVPNVAICEEGEAFFSKYQKIYPERLVVANEQIDFISNLKKTYEEANKKRFMEKLENARKEREAKLREKELKAEKSNIEVRKLKKEAKVKDKLVQGKEGYNLLQGNPKLSWRKIGDALDVNYETMREYILDYAISIKDYGFCHQHFAEIKNKRIQKKLKVLETNQQTEP